MDNNNHRDRPLPDHKVRRQLFLEDEDDLMLNMPGGPSNVINHQNSPANDDVNSMNIKRKLEEDQRAFNMKYNYNTTEDVPVPGRYIWGEETNGVRIGIEQTNYDEVTDEVTNEEGSIQESIDTQNDIVMDIIDNDEDHSSKTGSDKTPMTKASANGAPPVKKIARDVNSDDEDDDAQRRRVVPYNL